MPGVVNEIVDSENCGGMAQNVAEKVVREAQQKLDHSERFDSNVDKVFTELEMGVAGSVGTDDDIFLDDANIPPSSILRARKKRSKIVSAPIGRSDLLFAGATNIFHPAAPIRPRRRRQKTMSTPISGEIWGDNTTIVLAPGEMLVYVLGPNDQKIATKMNRVTYAKLCDAGIPFSLVTAEDDKQYVGDFLDGFVRKKGRKTNSSTNAGPPEIKSTNWWNR